MAAPAATADPTAGKSEALKPIHSLVLDTGPLIKNDPSVDALRSRAENLFILPSVIPEIRDAATRTRVETTLLPFVTVRSPQPSSVKVIRDFARRTGDLEVLSKPDLEVLALGYELECERNGGDWRLRKTPGQKQVNGPPPSRAAAQAETNESEQAQGEATESGEIKKEDTPVEATESTAVTDDVKEDIPREAADAASLDKGIEQLNIEGGSNDTTADTETANVEGHNVAHEGQEATDEADKELADGEKADEAVIVEEAASDDEDEDEDENDDDDDEGGWITPSNIKKHKAKKDDTSTIPGQQTATLQAAILTSDFAMQNVALRMNLNLVSPALTRISRLKTWVMRCHGCFKVTRDMERRFCPTCGQATLIRAACTVDDRTGAMTIHLKKNFQWNNRGNVYSVPKPTHGSSNGRAPKTSKGKGGQNRWGQKLILAEDQKEHTRMHEEQRRIRKKDMMDEDVLPGIVTGDRGNNGGKIRVGAGRNINSRKRH